MATLGQGCNGTPINRLSELDAGGTRPPALDIDFELDLSKLPNLTAPDELTVDKLTEVVVSGKGVFDVLMRATKEHLEQEHKKSRITGANYSEVYLSSLQLAMSTALEFLTRGRKDHLEMQVLQQQAILAQVEVMKAKAQLAQILQQTSLIEAQALLAQQQALNAAQERKVLVAQECKVRADVDATLAEIEKTKDERKILAAQELKIKAETDAVKASIEKMKDERKVLIAQEGKLNADRDLTLASIPKIADERNLLVAQEAKVREDIKAIAANIEKMLDERKVLLAQEAKLRSDIELTTATIAKMEEEKKVLIAQECKLRAEYDAIIASITKLQAEIELLRQKLQTEKAQVDGSVIGSSSVIGKQNALYEAQTQGFARDAEQKAAKIMIDTWSVRRNSDEATQANGANGLQDSNIGRAVSRLMAGIGA